MRHFRIRHGEVVEFRDTPYTTMWLVEQYLAQGVDHIVIEQVEKKEPESSLPTSASSDNPDSGPESSSLPPASSQTPATSSVPTETSQPEQDSS